MGPHLGLEPLVRQGKAGGGADAMDELGLAEQAGVVDEDAECSAPVLERRGGPAARYPLEIHWITAGVGETFALFEVVVDTGGVIAKGAGDRRFEGAGLRYGFEVVDEPADRPAQEAHLKETADECER